MNNDTRDGVYHKFNVERADPEAQARHRTCAYFVLDVDHDPHALPALVAYADAAAAEYPKLADDLRWAVHRMTINQLMGKVGA